MICQYIIALVFFIASTFCTTCGRDIPCLAENAQMTFLGRVINVEKTNSTYFSAEVQPLCTMYSTVQNTKLDEEEFQRTVFIDGFGTHAGGSCNADSGIVGDTNIFFVWVNASRVHGVARRFGLYDPCYGAFKYTDENANQLNNFMASHNSMVPTPTGKECPSDAGKPGVSSNGMSGSINLEDGFSSNAMMKYTLSFVAILASLLALFIM
ncbi:hypothetical protein BCR36DRAFT_579950 [Piromyces finnis]|uniref:Uncharacterized protein n=1 Tax=Piromyces finnis TaxID=1754191 RepID=A0A1Y1VLM1_9FUNG|nr:hypothetical protein BCR36DRAFT_579950 [Piromyces finnis]|eukprot:ORX59361.1 hypothetical protein BCR36DRAFT_579950 [Piromyces finnis]